MAAVAIAKKGEEPPRGTDGGQTTLVEKDLVIVATSLLLLFGVVAGCRGRLLLRHQSETFPINVRKSRKSRNCTWERTNENKNGTYQA